MANECWRIARESVALVERTIQEENIDADFRRTGRIRLAVKAGHFARMCAEADRLQSRGEEYGRLMGANELREETGVAGVYGGLLDTESGCLHPAKYLFGLAQAAVGHGAVLVEGTPATRISRHSGGMEVGYAGGVVRAREVIVATNGYTDGLLPSLRRRVFPVGSFAMVTEPLGPAQRDYFSRQQRIFVTSLNFLNYFRLTPDGRIYFGGRNNLRPSMQAADDHRQLAGHFHRLFPDLSALRTAYAWGGRLGFSFDRMPHIGRLDGVHYAVGYCGHGVPTATYCGQELARSILGHEETTPFAGIKHKGNPLYRGNPWFLPLVSLYYRAKDYLY